jgi:hypothetical protein
MTSPGRRVDVSAEEFRALFEEVRNWDRWGERKQRGALNHLTPDRIAAAGRLVRSGTTVTLSRSLQTHERIDCPEPADHHMTMLTDVDLGSGSMRLVKDYVGVDYHNEGHSHIDAFSQSRTKATSSAGSPTRLSPREAPMRTRSRFSRMASSDGVCCSTSLVPEASTGSSRASTFSPKTSRRPRMTRASP